MTKHRSVSIIVTACAIFFLTFLGMRISLLERTAKPKSKPRAVLKLASKAPATTVKIEKQKQQQIYVGTTPSTATLAVVEDDLLPATLRNNNYLIIVSYHSGRSPPRC